MQNDAVRSWPRYLPHICSSNSFFLPLCDRLMWNSRANSSWGIFLCGCNMCTVFSFMVVILRAKTKFWRSPIFKIFSILILFFLWARAIVCMIFTVSGLISTNSRPARLVLLGPLKWPVNLWRRMKKLWTIICIYCLAVTIGSLVAQLDLTSTLQNIEQ